LVWAERWVLSRLLPTGAAGRAGLVDLEGAAFEVEGAGVHLHDGLWGANTRELPVGAVATHVRGGHGGDGQGLSLRTCEWIGRGWLNPI